MRINSITTPYNYPKTPTMKGKYTPQKCASASLVAAPLIKLSPVLLKFLSGMGCFILGYFLNCLVTKLRINCHKKTVK